MIFRFQPLVFGGVPDPGKKIVHTFGEHHGLKNALGGDMDLFPGCFMHFPLVFNVKTMFFGGWELLE